MAAILPESTVVVVVARTSPRAILLALITTRKSIHGFPLVSYMGMGLCLAASGRRSSAKNEKRMFNALEAFDDESWIRQLRLQYRRQSKLSRVLK